MKIHEYQAKQIMKMYGISVPNGSPAFSPEEAARPSLKRRSTQAAAERRAA